MHAYHLIKLVQWAGKLQSRKRLQKVVYLLQASGCPELNADYILHHYGPYSFDVASMTDQLVRMNLLHETAESTGVGTQYSYKVSEGGAQTLQQFEASEQGKSLSSFCAREAKAKELLGLGMGDLEYGSTMLYFYRQTRDWQTAVAKTCAMKKLDASSAACKSALQVAQKMA